MRKMNGTTIDRVFCKSLGKILSKKRISRNYSLRDMAEMTGLSRQTIDDYELGRSRIDDKTWKLITDAC